MGRYQRIGSALKRIAQKMKCKRQIGHLIALGASQVHGTVAEPLNNSFPSAGAFYLYDAGYTASESWLYNQPYLFWQNAYWGDGLAAPFCG